MNQGNLTTQRLPGLVHSDRREFVWRAVIVIALLATAAIMWYAADVFLVAFAGILLAVLLDFLTG